MITNSIISVYRMFTIFSYNVHIVIDISSHSNVKCLICKPPNIYNVLTYSDMINSVHIMYHKAIYYIDYMLSIKNWLVNMRSLS